MTLHTLDSEQASGQQGARTGDPFAPAWTPHFPSPDLVPVAAATIWDAAAAARLLGRRPVDGAAAEGPSFFVTVSPGSVRIRREDAARAARTLEREVCRREKRRDEGTGWMLAESIRKAARIAADGLGLADDEAGVPGATPDPLRPGKGRSRIGEWSRKSRANMTARLLTLDYSPLVGAGKVPAMVTLTLPDEWETLTPTGADFKAFVRLFGKRYERSWGTPLVGIWKLEFQRRGAPHLHMLTALPTGRSKCGLTWRDWFAQAWADCLGVEGDTRARVIAVHRHPSAAGDFKEGARCTDPKRVAVYFNKHGLLANKEYQHVVPALWREPGAGPGRFWGVWGLAVVEASAEVTYDQAVRIARTARKIAASRGGLRVATVYRTDTISGAVTTRKVRRRVKRLRGTWGFLAVNDGAAFAFVLSRCVT